MAEEYQVSVRRLPARADRKPQAGDRALSEAVTEKRSLECD
jgi:hypothetical protein